ncbi:pilus assembly protein [Rhodanobacter spathiphylli]|uniref:Putative type 4 fimbrial biogenesis protein PilY1 n=1 Tax=Rhodanobacter spathiphylli B39 TaxID=1163407 RepID=I4W5Y8_9GAMM|nr:PilC/PilY family type IV pilus protein [Rhodanobacter spathiphylli]EIL94879.1 putative type 4 fimbrial biogenesis protein PilY1 [Rhodanobacter spathiphylli B39]
MNTSFRPRSKSAGFFSRLLYTGLSIWMLGAVYTPALAAVKVDQSPLIIQRSLPPNVVLMLDDSGSMDWDYMPDWGYLTSTTDDALRNASINGVYYNPNTNYSPPPKADGTSYPASPSLTGAYKDGFRDTSTTDITKFNGGNTTYARKFPYYTMFTIATVTTYTATMKCASGDALQSGGSNDGKCKHDNGFWSNPRYTYLTPNVPTCTSGDVLSGSTCTNTSYNNKYYFTYTTGSGNTQNYVGSTGDCAVLPAASKAVCDDSTTAQQNVANWFSYYRTRMLMAKSGLMNSFSTLDTTFRVGFGSINGNNNSNLPSDTVTFNSKTIARVAPFGDDYSATQKTNFWNWLKGEYPNDGTPLPSTLDAVGQYYQTDQPWKGMESDPDYTTAAASKQLACRQSYTILTTDGFWNGSLPPSIGDYDGTAGTTVTGPNSQSYTYAPAAPYSDGILSTSTDTKPPTCSKNYSLTAPDTGHSTYYCYRSSKYSEQAPSCSSGYTLSADRGTCSKTTTTGTSWSNTLADYAMKYWNTDLRSDMDNEVPTNAEDPAFWQHMSTFTLGLGFSPLYSDQKTAIPMDQVFAWANGDANKAITNFSWPKPSADSLNNIADLAHAAVNGHGGFYSANSPDAFANGLKEALKRAAERVGTGASLAANSTQLQTGTVAYQANYWTAKWKGDLKALAVDSATGAIATSASWNASTAMPTSANRNIKTYNPTAAAGSQFVDFKVSGSTLPSLSTAQHTALSSIAGTATNEADLISYLRGDSSKEQTNKGSYRNRDIAIGDIVNSQPVYAGAPNPNQFYTEAFTGSSTFSQFASDKASRAGTVYVASNDGMLHGFDAATGAENFAYLPGAVITSGVSALASVEYGGTVDHGFFNDGELTISDAYIGSPVGWKTVLVGTTGRGVAKTVYALDITDPASVKFLWERSGGDGIIDSGTTSNSGYIGQMTGKPVIAQTADGTWSVLIGNGYNSAAGESALLQFDLATGTLHVHKTGDSSGLAAPAVWMDPSGNGVSTAAYAGDANGNVWSFAINTSAGTSTTATPDSNGVKVFKAVDDSGNAQPITAGMLAGKDPATGNTWVFFGTGQYLTTTDLANLKTQSWYGLIVQSGTSGLAVTDASTRSANLVKRSITAEVGNGRTVTTLAQAAAASAAITGKSGWYIDLLSPTGTAGAAVQQGERMVTPNQFQGNLLLGTTRIPQATDPCNPSGKGWIMALDPFTGTNPSANFFDRNGDGKVDSSDSVGGTPAAGIGFSSLPNNPIFVGSTMLTSFDNGSTSSIKTSSSTGQIQRVSWRELIAQ